MASLRDIRKRIRSVKSTQKITRAMKLVSAAKLRRAQQAIVAALYATATIALGFHLRHGLWSFFRSLGFAAPRWERARLGFATAFAWIVTLGNLSFPVAVLAGWLK